MATAILLTGCASAITQTPYLQPAASEPTATMLVKDQSLDIQNYDEKGCLYNTANIHQQGYKYKDGIEHSYLVKADTKQVLVYRVQYGDGSCSRAFTFIPKQGAKYRFFSELINPQGSIFSNALKQSRGWKCKLGLVEETADGGIAPVTELPHPDLTCHPPQKSKFDWVKKLSN